jgi:LysM repeat protein
MTDKLKIKDHTFGYLPENDGYELNKIPKGDPNATTYVVKKGDSLWKIAFMFDTTTKNLVNINRISKKKPLKIG